MELINDYKCPGCGAALAFNAESRNVKCDHCGKEYSVADIIALAEPNVDNEDFNWDKFKESNETLDGTAVYQCQSCGAMLETDATTVATSCPYCDSNVVIVDRVKGGLKPNAVIPFEISKQQLPELIKQFYYKKRLLPKDFFSSNVIEKAQGIYVPFWLYDSKISGKLKFKGTVVTTVRTSKEQITTTKDYLLIRDGDLSFAKVPVDASLKMDNDLMDSIEPFDYSKMLPFDGAYLTGFLADRFDTDPNSELRRASERMSNTFVNELSSTASGFSPVLVSKDIRMENCDVKYVLLPVYVLNCKYGDKKYRYAINGQTGKVVGELPISKKKAAGRFFSAFLIAFAVVFGALYLYLMNGGSL